MRGTTSRRVSFRAVILGVAGAALLAAAVLALLPVKVTVDNDATYACGSPVPSTLSPGAKARWGKDTLLEVAAHPGSAHTRLPVDVCDHATAGRLHWAALIGGLGSLLLLSVLVRRALVATRRDEHAVDPVVHPSPPPLPQPQDASATSPTPFRHVPALDGMRGLAVLAVLAFHAGLSWAVGGFLGVDAFFVLSGYLITSLLVNEWQARGSIALGAFWSRRARRLLPALLLVLAAVALYARYVTDPAQLTSVRFDAFATLAYVANWRFIFTHVGYFDAFASPSPLRHMWSLAVEEQFYVVWPPVALLVLTWLKTRQALFWFASALALGSVVAMEALYHPGVDPTRVYYGTDTRAQTVLIGAALAALAPGPAWASTAGRRLLLTCAGVISAAFVAWTWVTVDGRSAWLYRGGLTVIALAVAVVIATAVTTTSVLGRVLSWRPLTGIGRISYGLYLWHWPIFLVITRSRTGLWGNELLVARLIVTFAVAIASFVLVERPIRRGALRLGWAAVAAPLALMATLAVLLLATQHHDEHAPLFASRVRPHVARDVHVLALGDSVALTLFGVDSPPGVWLEDAARVGCGVTSDQLRTRGQLGRPCRGQDPLEEWQTEVTDKDPDVVTVLVGRWEVPDHRFGGRWVHVGDRAFDAYLADRLDRGVRILSSRGAHVVLLTTPYSDPLERPDGGRWPEDDPRRVDAFNRIVREVASRHRREVSVFELGQELSPGGHFAQVIDGVTVRSPDGVHISGGGARRVARVLMPQLAAAGQSHRAQRLSRASSS
ncbi:MAG: acyltransferase family protein [Actinomycetota bacterium]|nr:acyltransferase family protein [Actinomycetota bacterium]